MIAAVVRMVLLGNQRFYPVGSVEFYKSAACFPACSAFLSMSVLKSLFQNSIGFEARHFRDSYNRVSV
jgi:hypothetical protein